MCPTVVSLLSKYLNLQLPVLVRPLLRDGDLLLLGIGNLFASLDPTAHHHAAEAVFEQVAFGLEEAEGVF